MRGAGMTNYFDKYHKLVARLRAGFPHEDLTGDAQVGVHCGVEDVGCSDRYEGANYGYSEGVRTCAEWLNNIIEVQE